MRREGVPSPTDDRGMGFGSHGTLHLHLYVNFLSSSNSVSCRQLPLHQRTTAPAVQGSRDYSSSTGSSSSSLLVVVVVVVVVVVTVDAAMVAVVVAVLDGTDEAAVKQMNNVAFIH